MDEMYSDNPGADSAAPSEAETPEKSPEKSDDAGETALLPKSILAGKEFKAGDEVILKIVKDYGDEIEVAYSYGDEKENPDMDKAHSEMEAMAE